MEFIAGFATAIVHGLIMLPVARLRLRVPPLVVNLCVALVLHLASVWVLIDFGLLREYAWIAASFGFGFMVYLFGFNALYKSLSLGVLAEMADRRSGKMQADEIFRDIVEQSFIGRVEFLEHSGLVDRSGVGYMVAWRGQRIAGGIKRLRRLLGEPGGGIYYR